MASTLEDRSSADIPCRHSFEMIDYSPVSCPVQRMPANHNQMVKKEVKTC